MFTDHGVSGVELSWPKGTRKPMHGRGHERRGRKGGIERPGDKIEADFGSVVRRYWWEKERSSKKKPGKRGEFGGSESEPQYLRSAGAKKKKTKE